MVNKQRKLPASKAKRWFVQAGFGPFSLSFGNGAGASSNGKGKRSIPTHGEEKFISSLVSLTNGLHQTVYSFNPLAQIVQGTSGGQREGDVIHLDRIVVNAAISNAGSAATFGIDMRVLILVTTSQFNPSSSAYGSGIGATDLFFNPSNPYVSLVDPRRAWILCDEYHHITPKFSTEVEDKQCTLECQINKPFEYSGKSSTYGVSSNIYVVLVPYAFNATAGVTIVGSVDSSVLVCFRNLG